MKRSLALLLLLAGCSGPELGWHDYVAHRTSADLQQDYGACQASSFQVPVQLYTGVEGVMLAQAQRSQMVEACMRGRGWELVQVPK